MKVRMVLIVMVIMQLCLLPFTERRAVYAAEPDQLPPCTMSADIVNTLHFNAEVTLQSYSFNKDDGGTMLTSTKVVGAGQTQNLASCRRSIDKNTGMINRTCDRKKLTGTIDTSISKIDMQTRLLEHDTACKKTFYIKHNGSMGYYFDTQQ
jgi:hypothetical protein